MGAAIPQWEWPVPCLHGLGFKPWLPQRPLSFGLHFLDCLHLQMEAWGWPFWVFSTGMAKSMPPWVRPRPWLLTALPICCPSCLSCRRGFKAWDWPFLHPGKSHSGMANSMPSWVRHGRGWVQRPLGCNLDGCFALRRPWVRPWPWLRISAPHSLHFMRFLQS